MICIELLGTEVFLPAFVVGYELAGDVTHVELDALLPAEGAIVCIDQQAGGLCMSYPSVVGVLLRLVANEAAGERPFGPLVRGLAAMAEDPNMAVLREYPVLLEMVATNGSSYPRAQLERLERYLGQYVQLPAIAGGIEAFIRFAGCDMMRYLRGWRVLTCRIGGPIESIYGDLPGFHFDSSNLGGLVLDDERSLDDALLGELTEVGRRLGFGGPPGLFLLWENSD